jgi:hypothetical protein
MIAIVFNKNTDLNHIFYRFPLPLYWHRNSFLSHNEQLESTEGGSRGLSTVAGNKDQLFRSCLSVSIGQSIMIYVFHWYAFLASTFT